MCGEIRPKNKKEKKNCVVELVNSLKGGQILHSRVET
jgi:hypothetical protein